MKKFHSLLFICLFAVLILSQSVAADDIAGEAASDPAYQNHPISAPGEIVVDLKDNISSNEIEKLEHDYGIDLSFNSIYAQDEKVMTALVSDYYVSSLLAKLKKDKRVESAEPNYYYHIMASKPNDPLYKYQWDLEKINVRKAWDHNRGEGVIVAVIDTGVAFEDSGRFHKVEDLADTLFVKGYNFVDKNDHPNDDHAHGTHVAGTIAQSTNNSKGVAGIAYRAKIMPLKVLAANGYGKVSDIADAVRYAADHGAKVINMSLGGPFPSFALESACNYAHSKGVIIVCAAGNERSKRVGYPAGYKVCVAVSATRFDDKLAPYSNRGKRVDIAAPGGDMNVDQNNDGMPDGIMQNTIQIKNPEKEGYYVFQGTSMACPHVAGAAALVISAGVTDPNEVLSILKKTARKTGFEMEEGHGAGVLDVGAALDNAGIWHGWLKLIIAIIVLIIVIIIVGIADSKKLMLSGSFLFAWIMGSCGLFFLNYTKAGGLPLVNILTRGVPEMDIAFLGVNAHINPIFYSVLIPFIAGVACYKTKWQKAGAGFALGIAASILFAMFGSTDVKWIPGTFLLDKAWLLINFALCLFLGWLLIKLNPEAGKSTDGQGQNKAE
ncbi:MAG: S8 family peptidase [Firmicutes bacterium]|nr:S8 family peptidase [Bacillota bacterium]